MGRLDGQHLVVTGAGGTIPRAICLGAAREGATVTCVDVRPEDNGETAELVAEASGQDALAFTCDLRDWDAVSDLAAEVERRAGPVDSLLCGAGGAHPIGPVPILEIEPVAWETIIDQNLTTAFNAAALFARPMAARQSGSITFITSLSAEVAITGLAHYSAAKGAVRQLMRTMAVELAPVGIRVNAVAPGTTKTPANERLWGNPEIYERYASVTPMARWAEPSEIVGAVIYLASPEASFTTGSTIYVDGGYSAV